MKVYSIFKSIDGECNKFGQGRTTIFIRLSGCNLRCFQCDTVYAQKTTDGKDMSIYEVCDKIKEFGLKKVTITGGEPLLQEKELQELLALLSKNNIYISMETSGSINISDDIKAGVDSLVVDYKTPSTGESKKMIEDIYFDLSEQDFIKFVIFNRNDYEFAVSKMNKAWIANCAFSPAHGIMNPKILLNWMLEDNINAVLNVQLHKYLDLQEDK